MTSLGLGGVVGNINIFSGLLTEEKMKSITNGSDCGLFGDFLAWDPSQWMPTTESVRFFEIQSSDLCTNMGTKRLIELTRRDQVSAINSCSKFGGGKLPIVHTEAAASEFSELVRLEKIYYRTVRNKSRITMFGGRITKSYDVYSTLPYHYDVWAETFTNLYDDSVVNISIPQKSVDWSKTLEVSDMMTYLFKENFDNNLPSSVYIQVASALRDVTCIIDDPLRFFIRLALKINSDGFLSFLSI